MLYLRFDQRNQCRAEMIWRKLMHHSSIVNIFYTKYKSIAVLWSTAPSLSTSTLPKLPVGGAANPEKYFTMLWREKWIFSREIIISHHNSILAMEEKNIKLSFYFLIDHRNTNIQIILPESIDLLYYFLWIWF